MASIHHSLCSAGFADACFFATFRLGILPYPSARQPTSRSAVWRGYAIGFLDEAGYQERCVTLRPGDRIFLYSDGITEGKDSSEQLWGEDRLMGAISSSQSQQLGASLKGITAEVERWCGSVV